MELAFRAGIELARLVERIARSPVEQEWIERTRLTDARASLWIDGELVHLEHIILHDGTKEIRKPTLELTIARDVLFTRRRIVGQSLDWALSADGIRALRKTSEIGSGGGDEATTAGVIRAAVANDAEGEGDHGDDVKDLPGSTNRATFCVRPKTCRQCCRRSSPSMPGTRCPCFSTPPGSVGTGIATGKRGCSGSPSGFWRPPTSA